MLSTLGILNTDQKSTGIHHEALFYEGAGDFLAATVPFVEAGVAAGESVMVILPRATRTLLEAAIGDAGAIEEVSFAAMEGVGRNPARLIPAWRDFLDQAAAEGRGVRGVGEPVWAGRGAAELEECARHESLLNLAFADGPAWPLLCPYDAAGLPDEVLERARRTHPVLSRDGETRPSRAYCPSEEVAEIFAGELPPPPDEAAELIFGAAELKEVRRVVTAAGAFVALDHEKTENLVLAANEVATNSVKHGGGRGLLRVWPEGEALVCEVRDAGSFSDPLVGRRRPSLEQSGGRGIWIVNQVCDLVQIRSGETGSVVRLTIAP